MVVVTADEVVAVAAVAAVAVVVVVIDSFVVAIRGRAMTVFAEAADVMNGVGQHACRRDHGDRADVATM